MDNFVIMKALNLALVVISSLCAVLFSLSASPPSRGLSVYEEALRAGRAKIVFMGDSIEEGVSQVEYEKSWARFASKKIRTTYPEVSIYNLSLPGRGIGNAIDVNYKAVPYRGFSVTDYAEVGFARPKSMFDSDVWPYGSEVGKSWVDHVSSLNPDLVVIGFGMNDIGGSVSDIKRLTLQLIEMLSNSESKPSIVLVTPMLPTKEVEPYSNLQSNVQRTAEAYTQISHEFGIPLIDANRQYLLLRDGIDIRSADNSGLEISTYPLGYSVTEKPKYSELELLGGTPETGSGNGVNHPTELGHREIYASQASVLWDIQVPKQF